MSQRKVTEIITEILDIVDGNFSLYMHMMDYAEEVFFDDEAYSKAQRLCIAVKSDIYRSLRIVGVSHEDAIRTFESATTNKTSIRAELKAAISF